MGRKEWSAVLEEPSKIVLKEFDIPEIGPEEGLLKVEMAGVCGTDPKAYHGKFAWIQPPLILGHEVVGYIEEVGENASKRWGVRKGDRVVTEAGATCGRCYQCVSGRHRWCENRLGFRIPCKRPPYLWGSYGEYQYLPPGAHVYKLSKDVSAEAAVLINAVVANGIQWVRIAGGASIGDVVVIQGMGAQGFAATMGAKESGASPIIITGLTADEPRFQLAKRFGADYTINVEKEDIVRRVREITQGKMADVVVDVSGNPKAIAQSIDIVRIQGTVVCASVVGTDVLTPLATDKLAMNEIRFQGVFTNGHEAMRAAIKLVESRKYPVEEIVTHKFPLQQAEDAVKAAGGETLDVRPIKVVLVP
ncbi:zinc-binding dehydrogenase [Chloroflexota bacterium]